MPQHSNSEALSPDFVENIRKQVISRLMIERMYRHPKYSTGQLAKDIGISPRQLSNVLSIRFHQNFAQLVRDLRVHEAMYMLRSRDFAKMTANDIGIQAGFSTRQAFYIAFHSITGQSPNEYRKAFFTPGFTSNDEL